VETITESLDSRLRGNDGRRGRVDFASRFFEPLDLEPRVVRKEKSMASSMRVVCPGCDEEFLVSPQFERMKIAAKCPFCEREFPIEQAKKVVRPSPILLVK
jgi:ribosomal protein S27E